MKVSKEGVVLLFHNEYKEKEKYVSSELTEDDIPF